jgi:hypothetical protein
MRLSDSGSVALGLGIIALVVLLVIFGPLATIWALNTLFPVLAIPYNFYSWAATLILHGIFYRGVSSK